MMLEELIEDHKKKNLRSKSLINFDRALYTFEQDSRVFILTQGVNLFFVDKDEDDSRVYQVLTKNGEFIQNRTALARALAKTPAFLEDDLSADAAFSLEIISQQRYSRAFLPDLSLWFEHQVRHIASSYRSGTPVIEHTQLSDEQLKIIFTSYIPDSSPIAPGGASSLRVVVKTDTGTRSPTPKDIEFLQRVSEELLLPGSVEGKHGEFVRENMRQIVDVIDKEFSPLLELSGGGKNPYPKMGLSNGSEKFQGIYNPVKNGEQTYFTLRADGPHGEESILLRTSHSADAVFQRQSLSTQELRARTEQSLVVVNQKIHNESLYSKCVHSLRGVAHYVRSKSQPLKKSLVPLGIAASIGIAAWGMSKLDNRVQVSTDYESTSSSESISEIDYSSLVTPGVSSIVLPVSSGQTHNQTMPVTSSQAPVSEHSELKGEYAFVERSVPAGSCVWTEVRKENPSLPNSELIGLVNTSLVKNGKFTIAQKDSLVQQGQSISKEQDPDYVRAGETILVAKQSTPAVNDTVVSLHSTAPLSARHDGLQKSNSLSYKASTTSSAHVQEQQNAPFVTSSPTVCLEQTLEATPTTSNLPAIIFPHNGSVYTSVLEQIVSLKNKGYSLSSIRNTVGGFSSTKDLASAFSDFQHYNQNGLMNSSHVLAFDPEVACSELRSEIQHYQKKPGSNRKKVAKELTKKYSMKVSEQDLMTSTTKSEENTTTCISSETYSPSRASTAKT